MTEALFAIRIPDHHQKKGCNYWMLVIQYCTLLIVFTLGYRKKAPILMSTIRPGRLRVGAHPT